MNSQYRAKPFVVLTAICTLAFVWSAATCVVAQSSSDFSNLQKHINKEVTVDTHDGIVKGQLLRVEESRIVVYEAGKPKPISRGSVRSVTQHNSKHTAAWIAGMSAAGLGTGFCLDSVRSMTPPTRMPKSAEPQQQGPEQEQPSAMP
jgi:hypothetical protein